MSQKQIVVLLKSGDKKQNEITKKRYEFLIQRSKTTSLHKRYTKKDISVVNRDLIGQLTIGPESFSVTSPILRFLIVNQE